MGVRMTGGTRHSATIFHTRVAIIIINSLGWDFRFASK